MGSNGAPPSESAPLKEHSWESPTTLCLTAHGLQHKRMVKVSCRCGGNFSLIWGKLGSDSKGEKRDWVSDETRVADGEAFGGGRQPRREERPRVRRTSPSPAWSLTPASAPLFAVTICSVPCTDTKYRHDEKGSLIYLGIKDVDLCLFCANIDDQPTLQLKVSACAANERSTVRRTLSFIYYDADQK